MQDCGGRIDARMGSPVIEGSTVELQVGPDLAPLTGGRQTLRTEVEWQLRLLRVR